MPRLLAPKAPPTDATSATSASSATVAPDSTATRPTTVPVGNAYDKASTRHPIERRLVAGFGEALDSLLPTEAHRVLDVGCGEGHHMRTVGRRLPGAFVAGVDVADANWLARWHTTGSRVTVGDAGALPFGTRTFDLVLALEVLEHLHDPRAALRQIAGVCDGIVVMSVPWEPLWRAGNIVRGRYVARLGNTPGHLQHFTRRGFVRVIGDYFEVEAVKRPFPWTLVRARVR
jgi:2-polyprenyl-3-methyl-5-hydroxy-6-metoxy-1,4-benzoquinol methylase